MNPQILYKQILTATFNIVNNRIKTHVAEKEIASEAFIRLHGHQDKVSYQAINKTILQIIYEEKRVSSLNDENHNFILENGFNWKSNSRDSLSYKRCSHCKEIYPVSSFRISVEKDGYRKITSICGPCISLRNKKYYAENKEKIDKINRKWALKNRNLVILHKKKYYRKLKNGKVRQYKKSVVKINQYGNIEHTFSSLTEASKSIGFATTESLRRYIISEKPYKGYLYKYTN